MAVGIIVLGWHASEPRLVIGWCSCTKCRLKPKCLPGFSLTLPFFSDFSIEKKIAGFFFFVQTGSSVFSHCHFPQFVSYKCLHGMNERHSVPQAGEQSRAWFISGTLACPLLPCRLMSGNGHRKGQVKEAVVWRE